MLSFMLTGCSPGLMYDTVSCAASIVCVCMCIRLTHRHVFILIFCFSLLLMMHRALSLTSIHPIQLPHPWMQWLWPYQWEILTTQKVGQIKNPPSVCHPHPPPPSFRHSLIRIFSHSWDKKSKMDSHLCSSYEAAASSFYQPRTDYKTQTEADRQTERSIDPSYSLALIQ